MTVTRSANGRDWVAEVRGSVMGWRWSGLYRDRQRARRDARAVAVSLTAWLGTGEEEWDDGR